MSVFDAHVLAGSSRYEVRRRIGAGGMGVVYEAFDRTDARLVALKTLGRVDANAIYRIKKEFRSLSDVSHPNLVALHELVCHDDQWFFAMELVDGVDLLGWVRNEIVDRQRYGTSAYIDTVRRNRDTIADPLSSWTAIPPTLFSEDDITNTGHDQRRIEAAAFAEVDLVRVRESFGQLADGLAALHAIGKLHRDIKPSNVLVTEAGRVVLLDFGLATELHEKAMIQSSVQGLVCGTIAYMSPEQGAGEKLGPASDWYSVGVMLFEALTGRLPFEGPVYKVLVDKQEADSPSAKTIEPGVPDELDELCQKLLSRDPAHRPDAQAVRRALGAAGTSVSTPAAASWPAPPPRTPFVGRRRELDALTAAFGAITKKAPAVVLVEGRSGMGKTALLKHFVDGLIERDEAVVLTGRCYERELVPFKAVDSLIDTLSRFLRTLPMDDAEALIPKDIELLKRVFPVLQRVEAIGPLVLTETALEPNRELRVRAFAALRELLSAIAAHVPLVIALDDLHWGDADSGYLLAQLLAPPNPPPMLVVASFRTEDRDRSPMLRILSPALEDRQQTATLVRLELGPLDVDASRDLAFALMTNEGEDAEARGRRATAIARESGGNPLFVFELAAGVVVESEERQASLLVAAQENTPVRQLRLEHVLYERIQSLPVQARRLLEVIAAAAAGLPMSLANEAAGLHRGDRSAAMLLRTQRLVRTSITRDEEAVEVIHERVRDAILNNVAASEMVQHHQAIVRLLKDRDVADPVALVIHQREAGNVDEAGRYAARAGRVAFDALAFERAAQLFQLAIELAPDVDVNKNRAWLGEALAYAGRSHEAAEAYLAAAQNFEGSAGLDLYRRAGEQLLTAGYVDRGLSVLEQILPDVGLRYPSTPERAMRSVTLGRAALALRGLKFKPRSAADVSTEDLVRLDVCSALARGCALVDMVRAAYFGTKMLSLALSVGEPHRLVRALAFEVVLVGGIDRSTARVEETYRCLKRAAKIADTPFAKGLVHMARGFLAFIRGNWRDAEKGLGSAAEIFSEQCSGAGWESNTCELLISETMAHRGRLDDLGRRVTARLAAAEEGGDLYTATATRTYPLQSLVWLAADRPDEVRRQVEAAGPALGRRGYHFEQYAAQASLVQCDLYEGNDENAWSRFSSEWPELDASRFMRVHLLRVSASDLYLRAALAAAVHDKGEAIRRAARTRLNELAKIELLHVPGLVAFHTAQLAVLDGDNAEAIQQYKTAAAAFESCDMRLLLAATWWRLGELVDTKNTLHADARAILGHENVRRPDRLVRVFAPVTRR